MRNIRKMWIFCFIPVILAVFVDRNDLENKEALAVTTDFGYVAIATQTKIHIFNNDVNRRTAGIIQLDYRARQKFLEFKMFSKSEIFYCDEAQCGLCTYSENKSSCSKIQIYGEEILDLQSASVIKIDGSEQMLLSLTFLDSESNVVRLAFFKYPAQDNGSLQAIAQAWEPPNMRNPSAIQSFQKSGFVYFIVSTTQSFEPDHVLSTVRTDFEVTVTKVVRICANDKTDDLASKIAVLVGCDQEYRNIYSQGEAAFFDTKSENLDIIMHSEHVKNHTMCRFKLSNISKRMEKTWEICQKTDFKSIYDVKKACKFHKTFEKMREDERCMIFTRMVDTFYDTTLCSKFGREEKVLENCKLDETQSSTYRNGWLENYDVLQGELMMQIPATENIDLITDLYIDGKSNFMTSGEKMLKFLASNSSTYQKLYQNPISSPNKFSLAILPNSNQLLFPNSQGIEKLNATCANLYKSCKELKNGGFKDPQKCAWCAKNYQFYTISQVEEKCTTIFTDQCPPLVQDVSRFANRTGIMIRGDDLKNINNLVVKYCETPCKVSSHDDRTILCETENSNKDILNDCEDIEMTGNIGSKQYSLPYRIEKSDGSVQTEEITGDHNKGASPTWKITLTIIAVLLLCFVVVILVYCMRNRLQHIKPAIRPPLRNDRVENDYHMDYITSAPRLSSLSNLGDQYVKIFRDLPIGLKIDYNSLRIDAFNVLGEGQYGMVYLAEYTDEEHHDVETVVCKKMKEGRISEFYEEARTMASFDHPNVVRLIGVALEDVTHVPLLIMEYMPRGDLLSLLKDKDANITMRDIFQFAIGIAEGMAHIHSKRFVHRDLAARNVMLDRDMKAKIADFGLCRKVNEQTQTYAGIQDRKLPISYYPPEVFENIQFTLSSDVWSFGIVIWELFTRGWVPYGNVDLQVLRRLLMENENNRLPKPVHCPQKVYDEIMLPCWRADPNRRPIFNELVITLGNVLDYMERSEKSALHAGYERISIPGRSENSTSSSDICE